MGKIMGRKTVNGAGIFLLLVLVWIGARNVSAMDAADIPEYAGDPYITVNENTPSFSEEELTTEAFEFYSAMDSLGRCQTAYANICEELMPTEERGTIGPVKPSGWHTVKYDIIEDRYLYNRCHLIGYQLAGENDNELNLITGTRYLNITGMLPFENMVAEYVWETGFHVLYRVIPVYEGEELVARGVEMEAMSVEDHGAGVSFHVFCYNVQPGIWIDYGTGDSALADESTAEGTSDETEAEEPAMDGNIAGESSEATYILNKNTKKFHYPSCDSVNQMKEKNKQEFTGSRDEAISMGYEPCGNCRP